MLKITAAGRSTTSASFTTHETLSGVNHSELEHAKRLLAENSARLANDSSMDDAEREHHAHISRMVTIESAVFTSRGKRYAYRAIPAVRS